MSHRHPWRVRTAFACNLVLVSACVADFPTLPTLADSDAGEDAETPEGSADTGPDATIRDDGGDATIPDGGLDATTLDSGQDTTTDAGSADASADVGDATLGTDGAPDASGADGGIDCVAVLSRMATAPITPPNGWLGLDLSNGGAFDGGLSSGGLSIDQAGILACANSVEPDDIDAAALTIAGARTATFTTGAGGTTLSISYNVESRVIWQVQTNAPAASSLAFHARAGGPYDTGSPDGGPSTYLISFGPDGDAGPGFVKKNGVDLPADWSMPQDDAGVYHASAWANEIYDGVMATYAPSVAPVADCLESPLERALSPQRSSACAYYPYASVLGVRGLGTFISFTPSTAQAQAMYELWPGGEPSCATPKSALEQLDNLSIGLTGNWFPSVGPLWMGTILGSLAPADPNASPNGMLATEANRIAGCSAKSVVAVDPGYIAEEWGTGEVALEYNPDSGVAYRLSVAQGFNGSLQLYSFELDGGVNSYVLGIGELSVNGLSVALDWTDAGATMLNATITDISNGWLGTYCGAVDVDCVVAGDCVIVPDDGQGHSTFTLLTSPDLVPTCGDAHPLSFVFAKGGSVPVEIYATNPGGE